MILISLPAINFRLTPQRTSYIAQIFILISLIIAIIVLMAYFCNSNDIVMKIGDSLKKLRESKGYTQQQMADLVHTHRTGYSKMENNQQEVPVDCLIL